MITSKIYLAVLLFFGTVSLSYAQKLSKTEKIIEADVRQNAQYLSSDAFEGRGSGQAGEQMSAKWIAKKFEEIGLKPLGTDKYFQNLPITTLRIAQAGTSLKIDIKVYTLFRDFYPVSQSDNNAQFEGEAINVSYGIIDTTLKLNHYKSLDVKGKAVLINCALPLLDNPHADLSIWKGIDERISTAISKGARAIVFYNDKEENKLSGDLKKSAQTKAIPIIFAQMNLDSVTQSNIDLRTDILAFQTDISNVVGFVDNGASSTVVIGAHHDHLGYGDIGGSLYDGPNAIHNGADDNASGVAGLLSLAKLIQKNKKKYKNNNYLFVAFTGEEIGLLGSKYFVANSPIPKTNINYMLNMDMIGMLDSNKKTLVINGVGTTPAWKSTISKIQLDTNKIRKINTTEGGIGASDHTSFYLEGIPAVHFFTGQHEHYHKPSDDFERLNIQGTAFVINYVYTFLGLMDKTGKSIFTKTKEESQDRMNFSVTLGVMPDYIYAEEGMRIDGVKEGKPGAIAGVQKGDIILSLGEKAVLNIQDYMKILSTLKTGDSVPMAVKRGNEIVKLTVTF